MFPWTSFSFQQRQLRAYHYKPFYKVSDYEAITSEVCPACNLGLKYIGYKSPYRYRAFMYCSSCSYWEEY